MRALVILLALAAPSVARAAEPPVAVTPDAIAAPQGLALREGWRYHPGDDPAWADPSFDDSSWEVVGSTRMTGGKRPASGWPGIGWFRLPLSVDPALVGTPVSLGLAHNGASEVYLDGRLVRALGRVSTSAVEEETYDPNGMPVPVVFDRAGEHVLAVRYSCAASVGGAARVLTGDALAAGFAASLADVASATSDFNARTTVTAIVLTSFIGVLSAFGLLHLFLYLFDRRQRANLFYSLFAFSFALNSAASLMQGATHIGYEETAFTAFANRVFVAGIFVFFLAFLYAAFSFPVPKYYWALVAVWVAAVLGLMAFPVFPSVGWGFPIAIGLSVCGFMHTFGRSLKHKLDGAWIIGAGVLLLVLALTAQLLGFAFGFFPTAMQLVSFFGFLGLPVCISIYLARAHVRTGRDLEARLAEVERLSAEAIEHERREAFLEAENARRAEELEEARQLQFSMLPAAVPDLPGLEIAAYMKPATEVGGDYYDFHVAADGTLTIAVGDATGHGLKAGTMVTATKGLFNAFAEEPDIARFFHRSSRALKGLNLRYLYMALMLAKVKGNRLRLSAAGMPPALVHRAATGEVEEIAIHGMPLGGAAIFPYEEREIELAPGDVLVFMSDGFPEQFNASGEMLDYGRAREVLVEVANEGPREIIEHFVRTADAWADGHPQDDDVTFVVIKVRDAAR